MWVMRIFSLLLPASGPLAFQALVFQNLVMGAGMSARKAGKGEDYTCCTVCPNEQGLASFLELSEVDQVAVSCWFRCLSWFHRVFGECVDHICAPRPCIPHINVRTHTHTRMRAYMLLCQMDFMVFLETSARLSSREKEQVSNTFSSPRMCLHLSIVLCARD